MTFRSCEMILILFLLLKFNNGASVITNTPCLSGDLEMSLEDVVHLSDVVVSGYVVSSSDGDFSTKSAKVSYYFAYKHDGQLQRLGFDTLLVTNFNFDPMEIDYIGSSIFFLVREGNTDLSLFCMSPLAKILTRNQNRFANFLELLWHIKDVGLDDIKKNAGVLPYPDPCDELDNGCSEQGSECSVVNTRPDENTRCTCITGFYGDGRNCTPLTSEASHAYCEQCHYNARCLIAPIDNNDNSDIGSSDNEADGEEITSGWITKCDCNHFHCPSRPRTNNRVCGSDGRTYETICHMKLESCRNQKAMFVLHYGACKGAETKRILSCGGMGHPLYTSAGLIKCDESIECPQMFSCQHRVCCPAASTSEPTSQNTKTSSPSMPMDPERGSGGSGFDEDMETIEYIGSGQLVPDSLVDDEDMNNFIDTDAKRKI